MRSADRTANRQISPPLELGLPYWFHLFFPDRALTTNLRILVVGCDDDLAVRLARANPHAQITAVEQRLAAQAATVQAKEQQGLGNLELTSAWPDETTTDEGFDLIYYNQPSWSEQSPRAVLAKAAELLSLEGSIHLTLRARYAWSGVGVVRELLEKLGVHADSEGYPRARRLVAALGQDHPWNLLGSDPQMRSDDLLADWLGNDGPCFNVPELYELLAASGLVLQRFTYQPYYLPQCSPLARTELLGEIRQMPPQRQHTLMELYSPGIRYHLAVACRADRPAESFQIDFDGGDWLFYAPLLPTKLPVEEDESSVGGKARLSWRAAGMPQLSVSLGGFQHRLLGALDRAEELGEVVSLAGISGDPQLRDEWARDFFQMMSDYDFLHFRICHSPRPSSLSAQTEASEPEPAPSASAPGWESMAELSEMQLQAGRNSELHEQTTAAAAEPEAQEVALAQTFEAAADAGPVAKSETAAESGPVAQSKPVAQSEPEPERTTGPAHVSEPGLAGEPEPEAKAEASGAVPRQTEQAATPPAADFFDDIEEIDTGSAGQMSPVENEIPPTGRHKTPDVSAQAKPAESPPAEPQRVPYEACPLCTRLGYEPFRQAGADLVLETQPLRVTIPWARCGRCSHVFTSGYFAGDDWTRILKSTLRWRRSLRRAIANRSEASRVVATITTLRESAIGRWLDVGCSNSGLVAVAAEFGFESAGVDCCSEAAQHLVELGYSVTPGSLFDYNDEPFDVVSLSSVVDAMPFPSQALSHVHKLLAPRGLVYLSAPTSDSLRWRKLDSEGINPYWSRVDRYHVFHRRSLFQLLHNSGFEPCGYGASGSDGVGMEVIACKR